ncbi:hypothetical protein ACIBEA_24795 [Streptomyces sp. NPDC051555]|uniref:hypothetical protein n=1 Tax=Streptomyces sp. NPDC051555 TaxID=3365657 RepID=UPI00379C25B0
MHGPGLPPPREQYASQRSQSYVIALRAIFTLVPLVSCGFLAWASMLRLAIVTRSGRDWALFVLSATCGLLGIWLVGSDPVPDAKGTRTNIGMVLSLATGVASLAYFLYADLRRQQRPPVTAWYPPPMPQQHQPPQYGYGYPPQAAAPAGPAPAQTRPLPPPLPQPPQTPPPPRIGQVRAELDELSELLRKQGDSNGNGTGGTGGQGHGR